MSDEIAKCGWCRSPGMYWRTVSNTAGPATVYAIHSAECIDRGLPVIPFETWNDRQARILAARRKDFEAGRKSFRSKTTWSRPAPCDADEGIRGTETWFVSFDDYIKEGA